MPCWSYAPPMPCSGLKRGSSLNRDGFCRVMSEDVDGAAALRVQAGLVGQQAQPQGASVLARHLREFVK